MEEKPQHDRLATAAGGLAILLWSTTFAVVRSLTEQVGTLATGAFSCLLAGVLGMAIFLAPRSARRRLLALPWRRQLGRGAFFVLYEVCLFLAVGIAADRQQVVQVSVINYLWPGLTLLLSVPVLHHRAKWPLVPGMVLAGAGVALAAAWQAGLGVADLGSGAVLPGLLALVAAVAWAIYNNLSNKWSRADDHLAVPFFMVATGAILAAMLPMQQGGTWTVRAVLELAYMAVLPTMAAMLLWNHAVSRGNMPVVASLSYATPLLSLAFTHMYLRILPQAGLWAACGMVVAGAVVCRLSVDAPVAEV